MGVAAAAGRQGRRATTAPRKRPLGSRSRGRRSRSRCFGGRRGAAAGQSPDATILGYVPDKSVMYGELRLDLPGDQRQAAGQFLSNSRASPTRRRSTASSTRSSTSSSMTPRRANSPTRPYQAVVLGRAWRLGRAAARREQADHRRVGDGRVPRHCLLSVKDPALAQAWFDAAFQKAGATTTNETYNGAALTLFSEPDTKNGEKAASRSDGKVAVIGDETSVKAAVDTNGNSGFAELPGPKSALDAADGDHIGFVYVALRDLATWSTGVSGALSEGDGHRPPWRSASRCSASCPNGAPTG